MKLRALALLRGGRLLTRAAVCLTYVSPFAVPDAQDTTGAGDAFAAGLIAGFLEGLDWEAAARMGCAVAALKIRHVGARSGLPSRGEVQLLLGGPV
jgi:ribokinase